MKQRSTDSSGVPAQRVSLETHWPAVEPALTEGGQAGRAVVLAAPTICRPLPPECGKQSKRTSWADVFAALAAAVLTLATMGCGSSATKTPPASSKADHAPAARPAQPSRAELETPTIRIETSAGVITLRLDGVHAPGTVRNFLNYANDQFYDNTLVHHVDAGKMIVAGGYSADRTPKPARTSIRNEAHHGIKNTRGTIAMTRDPALIDSATSQFFINLNDAPSLDHTGDSADQYGYCVFGEVIEGLDVAEKISRSPTANHGGDLSQTPEPAVIIKSVRVVR